MYLASTHKSPNLSGFCLCGCGEKTLISPKTSTRDKTVKGFPARFLLGHGLRKYAKDRDGLGKLGFGRYKNNHGYIFVRFNSLSKDEQKLFKSMITKFAGFEAILEHRLIVARRLSRPLTKKENVHHLNGRRDDNREKNLELWQKFQPCGQRVSDLCTYCNGSGLLSVQ